MDEVGIAGPSSSSSSEAPTATGVGEPQLVSLYPYPPQCYYSRYSEADVACGRVPSPPPLPTDTYHIFGVPHELDATIIQDLQWQGIEPLYTKPCDRKATMRKMNTSLLINFLDLLDIMKKSANSPCREQKINDIEMLFIQMHHLLNTYRTMQARVTLVCMRQHQFKQSEKCVQKVEAAVVEVETLLRKCEDMRSDDVGGRSVEEIYDILLSASGLQRPERSGGDRSEDTEAVYCVMCEEYVQPEPHLLSHTFPTHIHSHQDTSHQPTGQARMDNVTQHASSDNVGDQDDSAMETDASYDAGAGTRNLWRRYDALLQTLAKS